MDNKDFLEKILPHKKPMILIDDVVEYNKEELTLTSIVTITEDSLFYDSTIQGISSIVGIEYMAQTIGCYAFYRRQQEKPQIGFLLGTRLYNNKLDKFKLGETYTIKVKEFYFEDDIVTFECFIFDQNNEEVASATINTYQNDNMEEMLKNV